MTASAYLDDQPGPDSLVMRYLPGVGLAEVTAGTLGLADCVGDPNGGGTPSTAAAEQVRLPPSPQKNKKLRPLNPTEEWRLATLQEYRRTLLHHLSLGPDPYPVRLQSPNDGWRAGGGDVVVSVEWPAVESAIRRALTSIDARIERLTAGGADAPPSPSDAP